MGKEITEYKIAKELFTLGREIILTEEAQQMKQFTQHGTTSVFEHAVSVTKYSLIFAKVLENSVFHFKIDKRSLVRGALLHDYFLYDWHKPSDKRYGLHGYTHPAIACKNATEDFNLNEIEQDIIKRHMFPLTVIWPKHIEGWIVCIADKWCATCETFKVDISSYVLYRVNLRYQLDRGMVTIGKTADTPVKEEEENEQTDNTMLLN